MKPDDLPQRWKIKLKDHLVRQQSTVRDHLSAGDFANNSTKITFEDGSSATFRYTLVLEAPELKEIAVFTEHCGHHIFSSDSVETIDYNTKS